jgi:hypothetical protein
MTANTTLRVRHNVRSTVSALKGALVRLSADGTVATVLDRESGRLVCESAATLVPTRGRPINLVRGLCRADVDALIESDLTFCAAALDELFVRQTADEREAKATKYDNKVGYRADDARRGSTLALKALCAWSPEDCATARDVLSAYSGTQLWDLAALWLAEVVPVEPSTETTALVGDVMLDLACMAAIAGE